MQKKAFVLLSGGLDSTTCLYKAVHDYAPQDFEPGEVAQRLKSWPDDKFEIDWVEAISIDYGQRHIKETEYAGRTCKRLGISHTVLDVGHLLSGATVMLSRDSIGRVDVPDISYDNIKGVSPTYVPFRNGLMLSAITAQAQKHVNAEIEKERVDLLREWGDPPASQMATEHVKDLCGVYFGAHSEDAHNWAYPDCTPEFIGAMANAIYIGSYMAIRLHTPLQWLNKTGVVKLGADLGVPFEDTWSCYKGEEKHCGVCPTCRSRKDAFINAKVPDPTEYAA